MCPAVPYRAVGLGSKRPKEVGKDKIVDTPRLPAWPILKVAQVSADCFGFGEGRHQNVSQQCHDLSVWSGLCANAVPHLCWNVGRRYRPAARSCIRQELALTDRSAAILSRACEPVESEVVPMVRGGRIAGRLTLGWVGRQPTHIGTRFAVLP